VLSVLKPLSIGRRLVVWLTVTVLATAAVLVVVNLETSDVAEKSTERNVSPRQIVENVRSLVGLESRAASYNLSSTSGWRLDWWKTIADYTIYGRYFWTGKGFGVNLADDDGFQVSQEYEAPLRSPHNAHMTVLARMGVPGALIWIALQLVFSASLVRAYFRAQSAGEHWWAAIDLWILTYWVAFIANASFDVFLEGPQGGIWFWCLIGLGMAAMESQRALEQARFAPVRR
jgi:O-Antigen ligase